jgi:predicted nuclease of predicted toxin-antitoxin system
MATRKPIPFFTDADVPDSVGDFLIEAGHEVTRLRHVMLQNSNDPVVATACREAGLVLITHNYRDFRKISHDLQMTRGRFDSLHRVELVCSQVIAARRIKQEIGLIQSEWANHPEDAEFGIRIVIGDNVVRIDRRGAQMEE